MPTFLVDRGNISGDTVASIWASPNIHMSLVRGFSGLYPGAGNSSV